MRAARTPGQRVIGLWLFTIMTSCMLVHIVQYRARFLPLIVEWSYDFVAANAIGPMLSMTLLYRHFHKVEIRVAQPIAVVCIADHIQRLTKKGKIVVPIRSGHLQARRGTFSLSLRSSGQWLAHTCVMFQHLHRSTGPATACAIRRWS